MKKIILLLLLFTIPVIIVMGLVIREEPIKIGVTYMNMNNPYFIALNNSIKQNVNADGDILISRDPCGSQERQNIIINEMIQEGIEVLFLQPVDLDGVGEAIKACNKNGVPVIIVDSKAGEGEGDVIFSVLSDNYSAGKVIAEDIIKKKKSAKIIMVHDKRISSTIDRFQGVLDVLNKYEGYEIIEIYDDVEGLEETMELVEECILNGVEMDVIIGSNDPTALGALAALEKYDKENEVLIYGVDGSPSAKKMVAKGYIEGTSAQYPTKIGRIAVEKMYKYLEGEEVEKEILVEIKLITKDNIEEFNISGWE